MAEFNSYLLGKARKSVGNITLCYTRGKNIAKAKVFSRKDNPTAGNPGPTGENESAGTVIPAVVTGDPERFCRDR